MVLLTPPLLLQPDPALMMPPERVLEA